MRHAIIKSLLASCYFIFCFANAAAVDELMQQLKTLHTLSARFAQTVSTSAGRVMSESTGTLLLKRPSQLSWQVEKPVPQLLLVNQGQVIYYQPDLEQVTYRALTGELNQTPAAFLLNDSLAMLSKNYRVVRLSAHSFQLTPLDEQNIVRDIVLQFNAKQQLSELSFADRLGHHTVLKLQNVVINASIEESAFQFTPPKGIDVIRG